MVTLPSLLAGSGRRPCRLLVPLQVLVWMVHLGTYLCCAALSVPLDVAAAHVVPVVAVSRLSLRRVGVRRPSQWPVFALRLGSAVLRVPSETKVLPLDLSLSELHPTGFGSLVVP